MNNPYMELMTELPGPGEDWREQAVCREGDPERFYTVDRGEAENRRKIAAAKAICHSCPVQIQCLDYATTSRQRWGVWGGKNFGAGKQHHGDRTHCKNGHEFTPENTRVETNANGYEFRRCIACRAKNTRSAAPSRQVMA